MNLLAVETSTENCSAALLHNGNIKTVSHLAVQNHAEMILDMIDQLLASVELDKKDLDGIVLGVGPGSFTGVRIAASAAQGLALGLNLKVAGVSSLETLALQALDGTDEEYAVSAIDARMGEVYVSVYHRNYGRLENLTKEQVLKPEAAVELIRNTVGVNHAVGGGSGMELLYASGLNQNIRKRSLFPDAEYLLKAGVKLFEEGKTVDAAEAVPLYVRNEVTWKKVSEQASSAL